MERLAEVIPYRQTNKNEEETYMTMPADDIGVHTTRPVKAIALLSGGLDSSLALRMVLDQGIEVEALKFSSPFCQCDHGGRCFSAEVARDMKVPLKTICKGEDYFKTLRSPKYGYGSGVNPCIDCRIYMLKKAKEYAEEKGASFIFTGEALGQRPMSQHRRAMEIIERECGLEGRILRPLSAKHLPETEAEKRGWIDRARLLDISGRSRKTQLEMAERMNITNFSCPAGGCLLTDKNFARRLRDFWSHSETMDIKDISILKTGRHFRYNGIKIVVGRNEAENGTLRRSRYESDIMFFVPDCGSPITLLQGEKNRDAVDMAAMMTVAYSDAPDGETAVSFETGDGNQATIRVKRIDKSSFAEYLI
jgi:tRNA-uridine 2-sulfurtransferase